MQPSIAAEIITRDFRRGRQDDSVLGANTAEIRAQIERDTEEFLKAGGKVKEIESGLDGELVTLSPRFNAKEPIEISRKKVVAYRGKAGELQKEKRKHIQELRELAKSECWNVPADSEVLSRMIDVAIDAIAFPKHYNMRRGKVMSRAIGLDERVNYPKIWQPRFLALVERLKNQ